MKSIGNRNAATFALQSVTEMRYSHISYICFPIALMCIIFVSVTQSFTGEGSGTPQDPYIITNVYQLQEMKNDLGAYYALGNDIDASETANWNWNQHPYEGFYWGFDPIGTSENQFTGKITGNHFEIYNLYINRPTRTYVGFLGYVGTGGKIENIRLIDADITGYLFAGGLAGQMTQGEISSSYFTGIVQGSAHVGGLAGNIHETTITNSCSSGNIGGSHYVGGLVGMNNYGTIQKSHSSMNVNGYEIGDSVGGLVGLNSSYPAKVLNSYFTGTIVGGNRVGGLVGYNQGVVFNSYSTGSVTGNSEVGGLIGWNTEAVLNSFSTGDVSGGGLAVGGLIGHNSMSNVGNSYYHNHSGNPDICIDWGIRMGCTAISEQSHSPYFYSTVNSPMNQWDFLEGSSNGIEGIWRMCMEGVDYPQLRWIFSRSGDLVCPDGVGLADLIYLLERWMWDDCDLDDNNCEWTDINHDGVVNLKDFMVLAENWLQDVSP